MLVSIKSLPTEILLSIMEEHLEINEALNFAAACKALQDVKDKHEKSILIAHVKRLNHPGTLVDAIARNDARRLLPLSKATATDTILEFGQQYSNHRSDPTPYEKSLRSVLATDLKEMVAFALQANAFVNTVLCIIFTCPEASMPIYDIEHTRIRRAIYRLDIVATFFGADFPGTPRAVTPTSFQHVDILGTSRFLLMFPPWEIEEMHTIAEHIRAGSEMEQIVRYGRWDLGMKKAMKDMQEERAPAEYHSREIHTVCSRVAAFSRLRVVKVDPETLEEYCTHQWTTGTSGDPDLLFSGDKLGSCPPVWVAAWQGRSANAAKEPVTLGHFVFAGYFPPGMIFWSLLRLRKWAESQAPDYACHRDFPANTQLVEADDELSTLFWSQKLSVQWYILAQRVFKYC
ncbi:hypothetical protein MKZ38_000034 [Zalerion maritima]|uniref:F-box domain-containing protein n=1 Tax=Zalerion maritima TaxID=339359 RepID=A0AAD5RTK0_9PEZI|nr:hypothetical protein MKZ38_000034 [Zalerion maritima]